LVAHLGRDAARRRHEREDEREDVDEDQDGGHTEGEPVEEGVGRFREERQAPLDLVDDLEEGRDQHPDDGEEHHRRGSPGDARVESLQAVLQPADEEREAEDEEEIPEDRADDRGLYQLDLPGPERDDRDDQLGGVAEGRVQEAADASPVWCASSSVASPRRPATGRRPRHEKTKASAGERKIHSAAIASGTKTRSQRRTFTGRTAQAPSVAAYTRSDEQHQTV
jgi:hypothetical protein